jgi:hypothetical integral membrane protein (TIGR02206 family)
VPFLPGVTDFSLSAMPLFGPLHLTLLTLTVAMAATLCVLLRARKISPTIVRRTIGYSLAINELIWWTFRYSQEGFRFPLNLPLQLCDATVWATVLACTTLIPAFVEFTYFAGIAGAGMALLTPDLWSPWPTYPAIYFFLAHGGIVIGAAVLVYGRIAPLKSGAPWRAFGWLLVYASVVGAFNAIFKTNYMYLREKPANASLLDALGPWPVYLIAGAAVGLALFWLLWLPARSRDTRRQPRSVI